MFTCARSWFDASMAWDATLSGRRGRHRAYRDVAIQACLTIRVLFGVPLRQTTGVVESLLELAGLNWAVPDFGTLARRQKTLPAAIPSRPSGPLAPSDRARASRPPLGSSIADAPLLPDLLDQIPPDEGIGSVTGGGACDTRKCHNAIAARTAHAVIPPRRNAKLCKPDTPGPTRPAPERETKRCDPQTIRGAHCGNS